MQTHRPGYPHVQKKVSGKVMYSALSGQDNTQNFQQHIPGESTAPYPDSEWAGQAALTCVAAGDMQNRRSKDHQ